MSNQILLSDNTGAWEDIPAWARFLIDLGYRSNTRSRFGRVITLLSMPCDSAAAGLIALGAMIGDLENPEANDVHGHYDALLRYAKQYLNHCKICDLKQCEPKKKGCGYISKATGKLKNTNKANARKTYLISDKTDLDSGILRIDVPGKHGGTRQPSPNFSLEWYIQGEPPVVLPDNAQPIPGNIYEEIAGSRRIFAANLSTSFSGLCFAGRVSGETKSKSIMSSIRFKTADIEFLLEYLLTISGWTNGESVTRTVYYNTRTRKFDRHPESIRLVVADGEGSFLRVLEEKPFQHSDVIGVYRRTIERGNMEQMIDRLVELRQWYSEMPVTEVYQVDMPFGINAKVFTKA